MKTYKCGICNSDEIEFRAYTKANTKELMDIFEENDEYWCPQCDEWLPKSNMISENN